GPTGRGSRRATEQYKIHPQLIRELRIGEVAVIADGHACLAAVPPPHYDLGLSPTQIFLRGGVARSLVEGVSRSLSPFTRRGRAGRGGTRVPVGAGGGRRDQAGSAGIG